MGARRMLLAVMFCLVVGGFATACCDAPEAAPPTAKAPSVNLLSRGERVAQSNECASCHEDSNATGGTLAGRDDGSPRSAPNLTPDPETGIGDWSDAALVRAIREGFDDDGDQLCASMPRFAPLGDEDLSALIAYLRSLPAIHHSVEAQCGD